MKFKLALAYILVILFLLFTRVAHAQTVNYPLNANPDVPRNLHTYTQSVFIEIAAATSCQISGIDPVNPGGKCLGIDPKTGKIGFVENGGGLIGIMGNLIAMTFQIPASGTHYTAYLAQNFGIAKPAFAQAQGVGFTGLKPLLAIWTIFRNLIYLLFVFVFIIIGLGIMFRIKIDPRTVMTIQNQIPKIIVALILVTFSYAIAGFLIDMMYVSMYLVYNIFAPLVDPGSGAVGINVPELGRVSSGVVGTGSLNPVNLQGSNPLSAVGALGGVKMVIGASAGIGSIIGSLFDGTMGRIIATVISTIIGGGIGSIGAFGLGSLIGAGIGFATGAIFGSKVFAVIGGLIAFIVLSTAVLTALFRLWFQLLKAYIAILINIVLGPFWIAAGLIPTSTLSFSAWVRGLIADLASFPTTLIMLLFGKVFIDAFGANGSDENFVPPFVGNPGDHNAFAALIGVGIILLTPNVVNLIRQALKVPQTKLTAGIGQSVGIGAGIVGAPVQGIGRHVWGVDPYTRQPRVLTRHILERLGDLGEGTSGPINAIARRAVGPLRAILGVHPDVPLWTRQERQMTPAQRAARRQVRSTRDIQAAERELEDQERATRGTPAQAAAPGAAGPASTPPATPPPTPPPQEAPSGGTAAETPKEGEEGPKAT